MKLNREGVQLNAEERNKRNQNWATLEDEVSQFESATNEFGVTTNMINNEITGLKAETAAQKNGLTATNKRVDNVVIEAGTVAYEKVVDASKLIWKEPVVAFSNLATAYPQPQNGWAAQTTSDGAVYRYDGSTWKKIQQVDAGPVNALDTRLTAQLAEAEEQIKETVSFGKNYNGAIISVIDDDGYAAFLTRWKSVADAKGIKITLAVNTSSIQSVNTDYLKLQQLKTLANEGHELVSHTHTHPVLTNISDADYENQLKTAKEYIVNNGLGNGETLVYPTGLSSITDKQRLLRIKEITKKYHKYGVDAEGNINYLPVDSYGVKRRNIDANDLATIKTWIDKAVVGKAWLIFLTHNHNTLWNAQKHSDWIDYAKSLNVPIMTFGEAEKLVGNVIAQGDTKTENYHFVSKNGASNQSGAVKTMYDNFDLTTMDDPITVYDMFKFTITEVPNFKDTYKNSGGHLVTYRGSRSMSYQIYQPLSTNDSYKRTWNDFSVKWNAFEPIRPKTKAGNMVNGLTSYDSGWSDVELTNVTDTLLSTGGLMRIYKGGTNQSFSIFYPANMNSIYKRRWLDASSAWTSWEKVSIV